MSGRIYWRYRRDGRYLYHHGPKPPPDSTLRGATPRAWADFRNLGGKREPLVAKGDRFATDDPELAEAIAAERVRELKRRRLLGEVADVEEPRSLGPFAQHHLERKAKLEDVSAQWMAAVQRHVESAVASIGAGTDLASITTKQVERWVIELRERPESEGGPLARPSIRKRLNSLSNLFVRAQRERAVPSDHNPARLVRSDLGEYERPEPNWLDMSEAACLLEAARQMEPAKGEIPFPHPLLATFLLTGGRKSEVLGLLARDVDLEEGKVRFRPNQYRGLKSRNSERAVPMWPQLKEVLRPHASDRVGLLFPSPRTGRMIHDCRKLWNRLADRVGLEEGRVRCHSFRHTFCSSALQLSDRGSAVSLYRVSRWMGHAGIGLIEGRYGHDDERATRGEVLEYRIENHEDEIDPDVLRELRRAS